MAITSNNLAQEVRRIPSIATKYSNRRLSFIERVCIKGILRLLRNCSEQDTKSGELLAFGYHVHALKRDAFIT